MRTLIDQLANGHLGWASGGVWLLAAFVLAVGGGALAGVVLAGKDLGRKLAALMGAMFGPTAVVPAVLLGLAALALLRG